MSLSAAGQHDGFLLCQDSFSPCYLTDSSSQHHQCCRRWRYFLASTLPTFARHHEALVSQKTKFQSKGQANFVHSIAPAAAQNARSRTRRVLHFTLAPPQSTCIFANDITQGNSNVPGQIGYPATHRGYDLATGLGSVNAANLVANWKNITFASSKTTLQLSPSPVSIVHGQIVIASATVAPLSGSDTPTGDVSLLTGGSQTVNLGMLNAGAISTAIFTLPGGSYSVTASYGGDSKFSPSTSTPVPVVIFAEPSTTALLIARPKLDPLHIHHL